MDKGIKSKRRWAQWLGFLGAVCGGAAVPAAALGPEWGYGAAIASGALSGAAGYLAKQSKDVQVADNADNQTSGNLNESTAQHGN